tara:strand:+ start:639 stop:1982 length:1344 start_codon:yes stop_codon:yes gene_type:complete
LYTILTTRRQNQTRNINVRKRYGKHTRGVLLSEYTISGKKVLVTQTGLQGKNRLLQPLANPHMNIQQNKFAGTLTLILLAACAIRVQASPGTDLPDGESPTADYRVETVAEGHGVIWGMAFIASDRLLFTERDGQIKALNITTKAIDTLQGSPRVWAHGQGGLMDIAVPPDYKPGGWLYVTYSKEQRGQGVTALARVQLAGLRLQNWQDLLVTNSGSDANHHFGSRIAFDNEGHLFFTVGDRGSRGNSQDLSNHAGTVLRVNLDGSSPGDNPFIATKSAMPEIWSYGHRNPQGIAYDNVQKRLWINEHGPRGGDEINLVLPGRNYGWPIVSHGKEYWGPVAVGEGTEKPGIEAPQKVYIPSIAPASLLLYTGEAFPLWRGNLFSGALKLTHLNRVSVDITGKPVAEERLLESLGERLRQVIQSPEGWLYISTDSGKILRVSPSAATD